MPVIVSRRTRTSQPKHTAGINWANPLTNGLVHANNWVDYRDIVTNTFATKTGTSDITPSTSGLGFDVTGLGNYVRNDAWTSGLTKDAGTIVALWAPTDVTATGQYIVGFRNGTTGSRYYLRHNAGALIFGWESTLSNATTGVLQLNVPALASLSWGAANAPKAYLNGALVGTSTETALTNPTTAIAGSVAGATASSTGLGKHFLLLVYNRELSAEEHRALAANPWQIFEPEIEVLPYIQLLQGDTTTSTPTSSTGSISQTHILTGAGDQSQPTSGTGAISLTITLTGANAQSTPTSGTGAIVQTHALTGAAAQSQPTSSTGSISQTHILAGASAQSQPTTGTGAIVQIIALSGANCQSAATSSTGAIELINFATITVGDLTMFAQDWARSVSSMKAVSIRRNFTVQEPVRQRRLN